MGKEQEKLRTRREIEVFARKKAIVYSVIFMTVTCILALFIVYSSFKNDETRLIIVGVFILMYAVMIYVKIRHEIEKEENYKNEVLFEKIYLSKEEKKQVMPLDKEGIKKIKETGAKLYAKLTESNNIYIFAKTDEGEEEFACVGKGYFRKHYKLL